MLEAFAWGAASGFLARWLIPGEHPAWITVLCGFGGCVLAFALGHQLFGFHELHLFRPESLLPAASASALLLLICRRARIASRSRTIFS